MTGELDNLFAQAAAHRIEPDAALVSRVLADAADVQHALVQPVPQQRQPRKLGVLAALSALFGGGPALAAVGSAALAGLFFGLVQPPSLTSLASAFSEPAPLDSFELIPAFDTFLAGE